MKYLMSILLLAGISQSAFSMPCDAGYSCISETGKYIIELQSCRYTNYIALETIKINGREVKGASLNKGWDGDSVLAFEINLPVKIEGAVKILTAEMPQKTKEGSLQVKYADYEPKPMTAIHTEKISCKAN
ncbi:MAG: hypothetical protein PHO08_02240 [Methylococcales bacterium]|nr:hypothetical protein [Methylococcales bacterium]MDD5633192.1 hypothetical protein [Methylococcales bacterium]